MISLGIRYLSGYSAATDLARQRAEWPVHPGRVFLALAAAHYETGANPAERAALQWLESQQPPALKASAAHARRIVETYVPVNDDAFPAFQHSRQKRTFPKVWLEEDTVYLRWDENPPDTVRVALAELCPKVTRIGHSASLVQMWVTGEDVPAPNWIPDEFSTLRLRVPHPGAMRSFDEAFNAGGFAKFDELSALIATAKGKASKELKQQVKDLFPDGSPPWRRPVLPRWQGYINLDEAKPVTIPASVVPGPFDPDLLIFSKGEGRVLGLPSTLELTGALRNAAMKAADRVGCGRPEWLTGHALDGRPSNSTHAAFFPLAFVGSEHADGHVTGLAIALPKQFSSLGSEEFRQILSSLLFNPETGEERPICLWKNQKEDPSRIWDWELQREIRTPAPYTLRASTWVGPSRSWASVTPVVLHHYPKKNRPGDVERIVREAFASAEYPEPESVTIRSVSVFTGAGHEREMPSYNEGGEGLCRYQTHVVAVFRDLVSGPVLVGRGRFRGYGLFRPYNQNPEPNRGDRV
jgi:CRISPR-associated protein Csb2